MDIEPQILELLKRLGRPVTFKRISDLTGLSPSLVSDFLKILESEGKVKITKFATCKMVELEDDRDNKDED